MFGKKRKNNSKQISIWTGRKKEGKLSGKLNIQILEKTKKNFWENCLQKVGQFNFWKRKTIGNNIQTKVNIIAKKIIQH